MTKYDHRKVEAKWQRQWQKQKLYATAKNLKKKHYVLDMFPYPSGAGLHVGHPEGYTATDIYSRYLRMNGYGVLHPMGWDAFGLPAENYAIKEGIHPAKSTAANIKRFREQIKMLGLSYDWDREINTSDPDYYKWTQWLFLKLYEKGLAYRKEANVNWCPQDQTVLANEQVVNGHCERCGTAVVQKLLPQWFFKITDYADRLLEGLDQIDWPEPIKLMQRNWIGRSQGAEIMFRITNYESRIKRFVLLHGKRKLPSAAPLSNFLPTLAKQLEKEGYEVQVPYLPNQSEPNDLEQAEYVRKNCILDEQTVLLGHSFGGVVALRLLEQGIKVNRVVLVGTPYSGAFLDKKFRPTVTKTLERGFDFKKIKSNARSFLAIYDTNDYVVPMSDGESFARNLSCELIRAEAQKPHFTDKEEPVILKALLASAGSTSPLIPPLARGGGKEGDIKVFTTRPDTIFGATYMVLAPEHLLVRNYESRIRNYGEVRKYIEQAKKKTELQRTALEKDKTGVELKGVKAINPATKEEIPVWIADYVLTGYGTGAIMAVPAHDERDFEFAKKYDLSIREVVYDPHQSPPHEGERKRGSQGVYTGEGRLINSGKYNGLGSEEARKRITKDLGQPKLQYKLRDWLVSRQRYWGAPIPIIHCEDCGMQEVPEKDLPVKLPTDVDFRPTGESPLARSKSFGKVKCPNCGQRARRDTDTMDTFVDSSWYYLRFTDPHNKKEFASKKEISKWCPVDVYVGGAEHAVLHLMYARFFWKALADMGLVKGSRQRRAGKPLDEPFLKLRNQGLILGPDGQKMSKSRGNVINPDDVVEEFGADAMRMFEMFMGPLEDAKPWSTQGIKGVRRFLEKVWRVGERPLPNPPHLPVPPDSRTGRQAGRLGREKEKKTFSPGDGESGREVEKLLHRTVKKVSEDIQTFKFNTAVSAMMILVNEMEKEIATKIEFEIFTRLLAPFAPHLAEELWHRVHRQGWTEKRPRTKTDKGQRQSVFDEPWPKYDEKLVEEEEVNIVVQVNGKVRGTLKAAKGVSQGEVERLAKQDSNVKRHLRGKIRKVIYVPGKIVNFVLLFPSPYEGRDKGRGKEQHG